MSLTLSYIVSVKRLFSARFLQIPSENADVRFYLVAVVRPWQKYLV
jgi:hypothetical protein